MPRVNKIMLHIKNINIIVLQVINIKLFSYLLSINYYNYKVNITYTLSEYFIFCSRNVQNVQNSAYYI